ncbi:MAG: 4-alpha-glucanotransferase, partial [Clostridia bacterium]|nr:4-alpha-glucanotransferase [Clostridia bacterium]
MERGSGILMHITSLPNDLGIGTLGYESYKFIDFLERIGQKYWQILPLGQTGYGNSPYQCFSSFAGNPFLISLELLEDRHLLKKSDYMHLDYGKNKRLIDFRKIQKNKMQVLRLAYKHGKTVYKKEIENFQKENKWWIKDYALYMAVKNRYRGKSWMVWNEKIKHRDEKCMEKYHNLLHEEVCFWIFIQYIFFEQWKHIKRYANNRGIKIIGDIPIYTALDSADVWANSELFKMDQEKKPT